MGSKSRLLNSSDNSASRFALSQFSVTIGVRDFDAQFKQPTGPRRDGRGGRGLWPPTLATGKGARMGHPRFEVIQRVGHPPKIPPMG
jgi:hypothetical protein